MPTSLTSSIESGFPLHIRERGRNIFTKGDVRVVEGDNWHADAAVQGTSNYRVRIERAGNELLAYCDCPYSKTEGPCKHLWATILAASQKGYLVGNGRPLREIVIVDLEEIGSVADEDALFDEDAAFDGNQDDVAASLTDGAPGTSVPPSPYQRTPDWLRQLTTVRTQSHVPVSPEPWPLDRKIFYVVEAAPGFVPQSLFLNIEIRQLTQAGGYGKAKSQRISRAQLPMLPDIADREILAVMAGPIPGFSFEDSIPSSLRLPSTLAEMLIPKICATGRCLVHSRSGADHVSSILHWDEGLPWELELTVERDHSYYVLRGLLSRGEQTMTLDEPQLIVSDGYLVAGNAISRLNHNGAFAWISLLRKEKQALIPLAHSSQFLEELVKLPRPLRLTMPDEIRFEEISGVPQPGIVFIRPSSFRGVNNTFTGRLHFNYEAISVQEEDPRAAFYDAEARRNITRDWNAERAAKLKLTSLNLKKSTYGSFWEISARRLPGVVRDLIQDGWNVTAEGKAFRAAKSFHAAISSGVDWFELRGTVDYGDGEIPLPQLIRSIEKGENLVQLGDGSYGILPEDFLARYGTVLRLGTNSGDHIRFSKSQTGLLDVFLAQQEDVTIDETFRTARQQLTAFEGVRAAEQPKDFQGELRGYQKEGLGWLNFLHKMSLGGCLADDMGVGKTAQVLAMLDLRREQNAPPSLVVVPRSLIYNWQQEAARFTPKLNVLDHSLATRERSTEVFDGYNVVLTTYGTLRKDVLNWREFTFDYVILDEAQAIKNAASESAKAARLLKASHRLAMSGTPIENHIGELYSLFEFLNPGMFGGPNAISKNTAELRNPALETRELLSRAVRPFILRRTKEQVIKELPAKTEQTIYCELEAVQRKHYNELRDYYRLNLLSKVDKSGIARSRMHILEALLRLRQAACHPGLIDRERSKEPSAKLDLLLERLREVTDEGHKALVFSQFTSFLSIVRNRLDEDNVVYEYLDGATRNRQGAVERFQGDETCKLFLISLKAGGLGLNLTAADYVFLLDPWWNPAVESQAIDRTHRIGQTRPVFAYRIIAKDTVEEKVVELQKTKRELAEAIISEDKGFFSNLKREELEALFS